MDTQAAKVRLRYTKIAVVNLPDMLKPVTTLDKYGEMKVTINDETNGTARSNILLRVCQR